MAGMLTTIGIFVLFFFVVILPVIKHQKKCEIKYGIKAKEWKFSKRRAFLRESMPEIYDPSYSGLASNIHYRKH